MKYDVCVIGHLTRDRVEIGGEPGRIQPGGTAYYASVATRRLGLRTAVITKLHPRDGSDLVGPLEREGIDVRVHASTFTTEFVNIIPDAECDARYQKLLAVASPFQPREIRARARVFLVGPLTREEISPTCVEKIATLGGRVALDIQGYVRYIRDSRVELCAYEEALKVLKWVHVLKASRDEALLLTGQSSAEGAARALAEAGPEEVLVTSGSDGSCIHANGRTVPIPAYVPPEVVDNTGCGDTYLAAYLTRRLAMDSVEDAGHFASRAAGAKTAYHGAFRGTVIGDEARSQPATRSFPQIQTRQL